MAMLYNQIPSLHPTFTIHRRNAISQRILDNAFEDVVLLQQGVKLEANPRECVSFNQVLNSASPVIPIAFPNSLARNQFIECIRRTCRADHSVIFVQSSNLVELIRRHDEGTASTRRIITELASSSANNNDSGKLDAQSKKCGIQLLVNFECAPTKVESELDHLKRLASAVSRSRVSRKQDVVKMWVFARPGKIHNVEEILQVSGYELLKIRQEQIIQQIVEFSAAAGEDTKKISSEVASRLASEYENKILSAIPSKSDVFISRLVDISHDLSPPENPILYSFLLAKTFKGVISSDVIIKSATQMCADFVKRHVCLSSFASVTGKSSCYSQFAGIILRNSNFLDSGDDHDDITLEWGVTDRGHLGVIVDQVASYLLALLLVDQQYEPHLSLETAISFVEQVSLSDKKRKEALPLTLKHPGLWYFVNALLEEHDDALFLKSMLTGCLPLRRRQFAEACVAVSYLNILKVVVNSGGPNNNDLRAKWILVAVLHADKETLAFVCEHRPSSSCSGGKSLLETYVMNQGVPAGLLDLAVRRGNYAITEYLLEQRRHGLDEITSRGLVHLCVEGSKYDDKRVIQDKCRIIQELLVTLEPQLLNERTGVRGCTPLNVPDIHMDILKLLVRPLGSNLLANERCSALHSVAEYLGPEEYHEFVEFLVETNNAAGCFHARDEQGNTVLHKALLHLDVLPVTIRIFKTQGLDFNAMSNAGRPLLSHAIRSHRSALLINTLIDCGANNLEAKINGRYHLLHAAAAFRNAAAIRILVKRGIHVNMPSNANDKFTPLHYACFDTSSSSSNLLETVRTLVDCGADVNAKSGQGRTCLHFAVIRSKAPDLLASLRYLICRGARVDVKDNYGRTMLDYALARSPGECEKIAQLTLKKRIG